MHDNMMNRPDNHEAKMARADLFKLAQYSFKLFKMINENQELEGWVQAKITKAADYIASVYHYMEYEMKVNEYGDAIENSDMYSETIRRAFQQKLVEAKEMAKKAKAKAEKAEKALDENMAVPQNPDGATAPPPKGKDGQYPIVTSGPNKGKRWSPKTPGPTNPAMKEELKGGQKKLDADKDGKLEKSDFAKLRAGKKVKEEFDKVGDTKKTRTGELTKTDKGVVHKRTDYTDDEHGEAPSTVKQKSASEKKADKANDIKLPKHKGNTWGMKGGEKFGKKMEEGAKPDFLDMDKDGNKKEPMKKAVADKKVKEAAGKCNHTPKGKSCPVHGLKECGTYEGVAEGTEPKLGTVKANLMNTKEPTVQVQVYKHNTLRGDSYWVNKEVKQFKTMDQAQAYVDRINKQGVAEGESHQAKTTMKHVKDPTPGEKKAAKDIKPGIAGYKDRVAMLKSAEKDGRLKA